MFGFLCVMVVGNMGDGDDEAGLRKHFAQLLKMGYFKGAHTARHEATVYIEHQC